MIIVDQIKLKVNESENKLPVLCAKKLSVSPDSILEYKILRKSIDARKKPEVFYVYQVAVKLAVAEDKILKKHAKDNQIRAYKPIEYNIPLLNSEMLSNQERPIIIGAGPAGLFAALYLSRAGLKPIIIERGKKVEDRSLDVEEFFKTGILNPESNCLFGEGGAGTFSDGKLNTLVNDKCGRNDFVLNTFTAAGANPAICYDYKPHIGTDILTKVIAKIREDIIELGGEFRFMNQLVGITTEGNSVTEITVKRLDSDIRDNNNPDTKSFDVEGSIYKLKCNRLILAIGHSARDTFSMLSKLNGLEMKAKEFAVGFRIEHPQQMISESMYGEASKDMEPAAYKLTYNHENGRGVYSFCMCPGGYVVNSSSENGMTCCNGMSYSARDGQNANSAIVVQVGANEYDLDKPLAGIEYQRSIEQKAYELGKGKLPQQLYRDFVNGNDTVAYGEFNSTTKGPNTFARLDTIYSSEMNNSIIDAMKDFGRKIKGFDREDAILTGVESRTSSPVRITRNEHFVSSIEGIYPCGEGAGYAGGIMSAAMDGLKVAEAIVKEIIGD